MSMISAYYQHLLAAEQFTQSLNFQLPCSIQHAVELQRPHTERLVSNIIKYLKPLPKENYIANCSIISQCIIDFIHQYTEYQAFLTIGYVKHHGQVSFPVSQESINEAVKKAPTSLTNMSHHAWVTLDNLMIIDATYLSTYAYRYQQDNLLGKMITHNSNDFTQHNGYFPVLLHEGFYQYCDPDYQQQKQVLKDFLALADIQLSA